MMKTGIEKIKVNGIAFTIGYLCETEFSGYVCEMNKAGDKYGVLFTNENNRELGYNSGIYATDEELEAIKEARRMMYEKYGNGRFHG